MEHRDSCNTVPTVSGEDDASLVSLNSFVTTLNYDACCDMLEDHLRCLGAAKRFYRPLDSHKFSFRVEELFVDISVRIDMRAIDISSVIYRYNDEHSSNKRKPTPYSLMTKMMKYKAVLNRSTKQEQVGTFDGKFVYLLSIPVAFVKKEHFIDFARDLDYFIAKAQNISNDFNGRATKNPQLMLIERGTWRQDRRRSII